MENPIAVGLLIFVAWFFSLWGLSAVLVDKFGMVEKYAFPGAMLLVSVPVVLVVLALYGQDQACWVGGTSAFINLCIWISGGF